LIRRDQLRLTVESRADELVREVSVLVDRLVGLRDVVTLLLEGAVPADLVEDLAVPDLPVRRLDEAVLVHSGVGRERRDEADVRTFRRLDGADAAVVSRVDVADLEARALARETARSERRETTLVRDLGERVGLVHELRELAAAEVLLDHGADGLRVDQVVRHEGLNLLRHAHALLDGALHADQTDAVLVLHQLAHGAHATVAQVVDVVGGPATVLELDQVTHGLEDVALGERGVLDVRTLAELLVELVVQLQAADLAQVVALGV